METLEALKNIGLRGSGDVYLGVVGPVRVGKSTFVKKFMEQIVIDNIIDEQEKKIALDELPLSGEGKTIFTTEVKFVPSNATTIKIDDSLSIKVRLIDCVGYIIDNANGYLEDGKMRMVKTPWFNELIPFDEASKIGTQKVIKDHSTLGIVILSDGTINNFSLNDYKKVENKIIEDVKNINKPFVIVLNSKTPNLENTIKYKEELEKLHQVPVIPLDIMNMNKIEATQILAQALELFPLSGIEMDLPKWVNSLDEEHYIKISLKNSLQNGISEAKIIKDVAKIKDILLENEYLSNVNLIDINTGTGIVKVRLEVKENLYERVLEELVGCKISSKDELIKVLTSFVKAKKDYDLIGSALEMANASGYGFSQGKEIKIERPELSKVSSRHALKIKASTSAYHIIKVDMGCTFEPVLGSKEQADYFLEYLLKAYENSEASMLECEMFGKKFKDILNDSISGKLHNLPEPIKMKLQQIIRTISNKGKGNLIAFVF